MKLFYSFNFRFLSEIAKGRLKAVKCHAGVIIFYDNEIKYASEEEAHNAVNQLMFPYKEELIRSSRL